MKRLLCTALFASAVAVALAQETKPIHTVDLKNNGTFSAGIWVNGAYQGQVPAGKCHYTVREGFVTKDSGIQPDGKKVLNHSHAGWEGSPGVTIKIIQASGDKTYRSEITVQPNKDGIAKVWFGEKNARQRTRRTHLGASDTNSCRAHHRRFSSRSSGMERRRSHNPAETFVKTRR